MFTESFFPFRPFPRTNVTTKMRSADGTCGGLMRFEEELLLAVADAGRVCEG
jgi:hypothetical protein